MISFKIIVAISRSFGVSFTLVIKSCASATVSFVKSTIFFPCSRPPRNTFSASSRRRAPLHLSHGSSPKKCFVPSPLHASHAPYGELNENILGSISGNTYPSSGQISFAERSESPSGVTIRISPSDSEIARSMASAKRISISAGLSENSCTANESMRISISCFLVFESSIRSRKLCIVPSIRAFSYPFESIS